MMQIILKVLKNNWVAILVGVLISLIAGKLYIDKVAEMNQKIEELDNNAKAYEGLYHRELSANNILKLSEVDLKNSKDSLLNKLGKYIEENRKLKKLSKPQLAEGVSQAIRDTTYINVPAKLPEFDVTKVINAETKVRAIGRDSTLTLIPNITNTIKIEIGVNRVYLNSYKNGWIRFWHFDWKKVNSYEYTLNQSNDIIKLTDVKIVEIK